MNLPSLAEIRKEDIENERKEVWIRIAEACSGASNATKKETCVSWADYILKEYDKRFTEQ